MLKIQATKVFSIVQNAINEHYPCISAQGGSRSGKTYNILIFLLYYARTHNNVTISIIRGTLPALRRSVLRDFIEILHNMKLHYSENKTELTYTLQNGSLLEFFTTADEGRLRGSKRHIAYINEATDKEITLTAFQQIKMRTTVCTILDYNPSYTEDHWLNNLNNDKTTFHFITTYRDNSFLEQSIINEIERLKDLNKNLYQIYNLGQRAIVEGLVFPTFYECEEIPLHAKARRYAMDLGFTPDPTVIIDCGYYKDCLFFDEITYQTHMVTDDIISVFKNNKKQRIISEIDKRMIEEIYRAGFDIIQVNKGANSVNMGILKMQSFKIYVTKKSLNLKKELRNYTYLQDKEGKYTSTPIDAFNHSIDAMRYYVLSELLDRQASKGAKVKILRD